MRRLEWILTLFLLAIVFIVLLAFCTGGNMAAGYPDWTRAIRLIGIDDDGNPVTIRADADGFLAAILKGDYEGALQTIGLDGEGRITAYMVDDESQWGDVVKTGNAELAARLGSPVAWDWRGKVIYWTDFRHGLSGLHTVASGTGASANPDPSKSLSGGYSIKLIGGSSSAYYAGVSVAIDMPPTDRVGIYIRWCSDSAFDRLHLQMQIYDGMKYHEAFIRYDKDNDEIDYIDSGRAWQSLAAQKFHSSDYAWHGLKLVVDVNTDKYLRCLAGSTEHDMSALSMYNIASSLDQRLLCAAYVYSHSGNNEYAWIDSMVITVGEPT